MNKLVGLSVGLGAGLLLGLGAIASPALAQESGVANTAEDFKSTAENSDGIFGSGMSIWDMYHRLGSLNGSGVVDDGFRRSQNRRIGNAAEEYRQRQRAILEQRAADGVVSPDRVEGSGGLSQ